MQMKMSEALEMDFESTERRNRLTNVGAAFIGKEGGREGGREDYSLAGSLSL